MASIVIAAHNEEAVIGRCLDALLADAQPGEFDVTVAANGCTDNTASVARKRAGVRVLDLPEAGKSKALNEGDEVAVGFPRIYLDADIVVTTDVARKLCTALAINIAPTKPHAAVPRRELDTTGRPLLVRSYFAVSSRLPAYQDGLFGRGMIALSEQGRARFVHFPEMVADDLFLDSQFRPDEKLQVAEVHTVVATPRRTTALIRRLARARRGNAEMRAAGRSGEVPGVVRSADRFAWFRDVVVPNPRLAPAAVVYVGITTIAAVLAKRQSRNGISSWGRDESTRSEFAETSDTPETNQ